MEDPRDQQLSTTSPGVMPPVYSMPPQYYMPAPVARPSRWLRFRRLMRLLLRRLFYGTVVVGRALRPFAVFIVVVLALLGVIGWMSYTIWAPKDGAPPDPRISSIPPALAVENYMKGRQSFNADMMWEAFSTDYQAAQLERGASKSTMQTQANNERLMGLQYVRYDYIGGVKTDDGGGMYFYSLDLALQNQHAKLPIVFAANADGKIDRIILPQSQSQGQSQSQ